MPVTGPDFVSLQTRDLAASQAFYEQYLGLVRSPAGPPHAVVFTTTPIAFALREAVAGTDIAGTPQPGIGAAMWLHATDVQAIHDALVADGVDLRLERSVASFTSDTTTADTATLDDGSVVGFDMVLAAMGRTSSTSGLGLDRAGQDVPARLQIALGCADVHPVALEAQTVEALPHEPREDVALDRDRAPGRDQVHDGSLEHVGAGVHLVGVDLGRVGLLEEAGDRPVLGPANKPVMRGVVDRVERQRAFLSALVKKATSPATLVNPFRVVPLTAAVTAAITVDESDHVWNLAGLGFAMRGISSGDGVTTTVPVGGLFRRGDGWAVFVVDNGHATLRNVELGHRNSDAGEIVKGLQPGELVILHPPDTLTDGARVIRRESS